LSVLTQRILTAAVLVGILILVLFFLPPAARLTFFAAFLLMGAWEWSGFVEPDRVLLRWLYVATLTLLAAIIANLSDEGFMLDLLLWIALAWWIAVAGWMLSGGVVMALPAVMLAGAMGLLPAWYAIIGLFDSEQGSWLFVWVAAIVAAADTGAFFVGRAIGRIKLAPAISPGKTREGMIGGVGFAALVSAGGALLTGQNAVVFALGGAVIALASVAGDLLVSVCKRRAGLKDSGWLLPGHGGVLDRIDGLLAALPLFLLLLVALGVLSQDLTSSR
jgi:phosphatidate cytidylyltransferase